MDEYAVDILPGDVLRWLRLDAGKSAPSLWVRASKEYTLDTDFDRQAYGLSEEDDLSLVSAHGLLEVSPQYGPGGWTLQLRAEDVVGLLPVGPEDAYEDENDMPVDAFEEQFLTPEKGEVEVVVQAEDGEAWTRFQEWLKGIRKA